MQEFLLYNYEWLKALHIIAVISWMAGMLYLPRLFVYHADSEIGSDKSETFKVMEKRLMRYIMEPASILTWVFGGLMLWANPALLSAPWMHVKLTCVVIMTVIYHMFMIWQKKFERDENTKTAKFFKIVNEVPTLLMIIIVIMVVVRPF